MYCKMVFAAPIRSYGDTTNVDIAQRNKHLFVAYADVDGNLTVARRDGVTGEWTKKHNVAPTLAIKDASHNQIELAVDGDGYIHVFWGMHNREHFTGGMRYMRSNAPDNVIKGFSDCAKEIPGYKEPFSYPSATTAPNGDVFLSLRQDNKFLPLYQWNTRARTWKHLRMIADGTPTNNNKLVYVPYLPVLHVDRAGDVHIQWQWSATRARGERHNGSYARYDPVRGKLYRANGKEQIAPFGVADSDIYQLKPPARTWDQEGIALAHISSDANNRPVITYTYSPDGNNTRWTYKIARHNGASWVNSVLADAPDKWKRTHLLQDGDDLYCYGRTPQGTAQWLASNGSSFEYQGAVSTFGLDGVALLDDGWHVLLHLGTDKRKADSQFSYIANS